MRAFRLGIVATVAAATASLAAAASARAPNAALGRDAPPPSRPCSPAGSPTGPRATFEPTARRSTRRRGATRLDAPLDVMVEPVSQAEYARCVAAARLPEAQGRRRGGGRPAGRRRELARRDRLRRMVRAPRPARTGACRPTRNGPMPRPNASAASRRRDATATTSPALARQVRRRIRRPDAPAEGAATVRPFRAQHAGVADLAGNVWEWTNSCYERRALDAARRADAC